MNGNVFSMPDAGGLRVPSSYAEVEEIFGKPMGGSGALNHAWYTSNIVLVTPPAPWGPASTRLLPRGVSPSPLYFQGDLGGKLALLPSKGLHVHKKLASRFVSVFFEIWQQVAAIVRSENAATDDLALRQAVNDRIHQMRLNQHRGGFAFRKLRGSSSLLSMHAFGIASDWDPANNPRQLPLTHTLPEWWYAIWAAHGFTDGRFLAMPDPSHVQFARGI